MNERLPNPDDPRNWTEDYPHENGNYVCRCYKCERHFLGHKRRIICKECTKENVNGR